MSLMPVSPSAQLPRWLQPTAVAAAAGAACLTVALVDPSEPGRYPTCPFLALTGRWCPGCGTLRGMHHLLRGDVVAALTFNALLVAAVPLVAWGWFAWVVPRLRGPASFQLARPALVVVLTFWLVRNLPWFSALAPGSPAGPTPG